MGNKRCSTHIRSFVLWKPSVNWKIVRRIPLVFHVHILLLNFSDHLLILSFSFNIVSKYPSNFFSSYSFFWLFRFSLKLWWRHRLLVKCFVSYFIRIFKVNLCHMCSFHRFVKSCIICRGMNVWLEEEFLWLNRRFLFLSWDFMNLYLSDLGDIVLGFWKRFRYEFSSLCYSFCTFTIDFMVFNL